MNNILDPHRQSRHEDLHVQLGETMWNTKHMHTSYESENIKKKKSHEVKSLKSRGAHGIPPFQDFEAAGVSKKGERKIQNDIGEMKI